MMSEKLMIQKTVQVAEVLSGLTFADAEEILRNAKGCLNELVTKEKVIRQFSTGSAEWKDLITESGYVPFLEAS